MPRQPAEAANVRPSPAQALRLPLAPLDLTQLLHTLKQPLSVFGKRELRRRQAAPSGPRPGSRSARQAAWQT